MERITRKTTVSSSGKKKSSSTQTLQSSRTSEHVAVSKVSKFSDTFTNEVSLGDADAVSIVRDDGTIDSAIVQHLQDAIHSIGDVLIHNPRIDTALEYKNAIQRLLKSVVPHLHKKETISVKKGIMTVNGHDVKEYKFTIVSKINKSLDTVLKLIAGTQVPQLSLMKTLDEIKGLIVDLLR